MAILRRLLDWLRALRDGFALSTSLKPFTAFFLAIGLNLLLAFELFPTGSPFTTGGLFLGTASAVTPDSPEVRELISKGLGYLEDNTDDRLGGKCIIAMAFLKAANAPDHPRVNEAIDACKKAARAPFSADRGPATRFPYDVYSNGLAVILLSELDARRHRQEIDAFLRVLYARQKKHGGWGYDNRDVGDTSQTQYGILACWEAHRAGISVEGERVRRALYWLLRTQDPSGAWGYQGKDSNNPDDFSLRRQERTSVSMLAAGLGGVLMCSNILGIQEIKIQEPEEPGLDLPPSVTPVETNQTKAARPVSGNKPVDRDQLAKTIDSANKWMSRNWDVEARRYRSYYLYSVERYQSFQELLIGKQEDEPKWYNDGFARLKAMQRKDGGWSNGSGHGPDTAFSILFLVRSTRMSIRKGGLGGGTLVGGRGLPRDTAGVSIRDGRLFDPSAKKELSDLIRILEDPDHPDHDRYLSDPRSLDVATGKAGSQDVVRLQQLIRGGEPGVRLAAVRMLARRRNLDDVPALLFAMTDPDRPVVLAARNGLRFVSRRFDGYGLPDDYTDRARFDVIEDWKEWYRTVRPTAAITF